MLKKRFWLLRFNLYILWFIDLKKRHGRVTPPSFMMAVQKEYSCKGFIDYCQKKKINYLTILNISAIRDFLSLDENLAFFFTIVFLLVATYLVVFEVTIDLARYLTLCEVLVSLGTLVGLILLTIICFLYLIVSPELTNAMLYIRSTIRICATLGVTISLLLSLAFIKKGTRQEFFRHLFLEVDSVLERPFRRFFIMVLLVLALFLQKLVKTLFFLDEMLSMFYVVCFMNANLMVSYFYVKRHFVWFFGKPKCFQKFTGEKQLLLTSGLEEKAGINIHFIRFSKVAQQHYMLGNALLKQKRMAHQLGRRGMQDDFDKAGTILQNEAANSRYLGQLVPLVDGLESKLITNVNPTNHMQFMDEPTFVNMLIRENDLERQIELSKKKKSYKGMPDWTCPRFKERMILQPQLARAQNLLSAHKVGIKNCSTKSGLSTSNCFKYGFSGAHEMSNSVNEYLRFSKKAQVAGLLFSGGAAGLAFVKAKTGL